MSKLKKLEQDIQALKDLVLQLQAQIIALQVRGAVITAPPITVPQIPMTP
ncbi:MAG TPA: hypothetical protein VN843_32185 [Anaerolineales bacterium]|nr:hypothetical protein [Anaerolineales bacterium]